MTDHIGPADAVPGRRREMALFVALVLGFAAAFAWTSWKSVRERELTAMSALAELGQKSIHTYFAQIESALRVLSDNVRGAGGGVDLKRAYAALNQFKQAYPDLRIVILTRPDGQIIASSDVAPGAKLPSLAGESSFVLAREELANGATLSVGRAFLGPISKQWIIPLRYGVRDGAGKLLFLVGAGLPLEKPQSLWKDAPLPAGAAIGIVRDDGFLVSRYPVPPRVELANVYGKSVAGGPIMSALEQQKFPASAVIEGVSAVSGMNTIVVVHRLSPYPLTFYVTNPVANIWAAWWQQVQISCALLVVLGAGGVAVYCWSNRRQAAWAREREQQMRELESANRELEAFSYSVSHDLRAPLRSIHGFGTLLHDENSGQLDAGGRNRLQRILAAAQRMGELIDDLLKFSRISRAVISYGTVDVSALARECVAAFAEAGPERRVTVVIAPGLTVHADRALMQIVLENLLANAWKFTGKLIEARVEVGRRVVDGQPAYFVRDNGAGFDAAYANKLFAPFQRLHTVEEFEGTGIGLATVKRIIERHGGRVWIESSVDAGTTVYFTVGEPV